MNIAYQYRIYPTKKQKVVLEQHFGATRAMYNFFLAYRQELYAKTKKSSTYNKDAAILTDLKTIEGYEWLNNINAQSLQFSLKNLSKAYSKFFNKQNKFPKFHKKTNDQCFKIPQHFYLEANKLYLPKLKSGIKVVQDRQLFGKTICCFIRKTASGEYYTSIVCDTTKQHLPQVEKSIGIDLGLTHLLITSDGIKHDNPKHYKFHKKKIAYQHRQLSKKQKGSNNRNKARKELAKTYRNITNSRNDNLHKITKQLINENQVIVAEDLSSKNMMQNHKLAAAISDASWGELIRQLKYKSEWYGRYFVQIDRFFASSKTCCFCNYKLKELPLNIREWGCPNCKTHHDRDINAANNILTEGIKKLIETSLITAAMAIKAMSGCGMQSDTKQKLDEALSQSGQVEETRNLQL